MKRSLDFYENIIGLKRAWEPQIAEGKGLEAAVKIPRARLEFVMLESPDGGTMLELIHYLMPKGKKYDRRNCDDGNMHIAFRVDDIDKAYTLYKNRGVKFNGPPVRILKGPLRGKAFVYFEDPDGVTLELFEDPKKPKN